MLRPRIIPCLLVRNRGLVKTVAFRRHTYIGDPINAVRIFNEKEADELMILDIDATVNGVEPDFKMIQSWAAECRMPLCYGGGIKDHKQASTIIRLGVEKIAVSEAAVHDPLLVGQLAREVGSQSVVVVLDVKRSELGQYEVWTHNARNNTGLCPLKLSRKLQDLGVGEIVLNSIDRDGEMKGYDLELAVQIRNEVTVPLTVLGGAGSLDNIGELISRLGIVGAAAGSLFVFKGSLRAVLINYPNPATKDQLVQSCWNNRSNRNTTKSRFHAV